MTYEELVKKVHAKPFDLKLFVIFFFNGFPNALLISSLVMIMYTPPIQHCKLPSYALDIMKQNSSTSDAIINFFIPRDPVDGSLNKCLKYKRSYHQFVAFWNQTLNNGTDFFSINATTVTCGGDKRFTNPHGKLSAAMEFDWTCERSWLKPLSSLILLFGICVGSFSGFLSDKFGRKPVFCVCTLLLSLITFFLGFANSDKIFIILLFFGGLFSLVNFVSGFVLGVECTVSTSRNFLSIGSFVSFALGYGISSLVGYLTSDWRWQVRVLGLLGTVFIANIWLLPESPRWLMANGKIEKAKKVFATIARYNGKENVIKELNDEIDQEVTELLITFGKEKKERNVSHLCNMFREICVNLRMLAYWVIVGFSWFTVTLLYYGISLSVQALSGNLYVNNTLMGLVEIPGLAIAFLCVKYVRRTISHGGMMALSGIFCLVAALISETNQDIASVVALLGKGLNSGAFYMVYIHSVEIYPTPVRNSCTSLGSAVGRLGGLVSPYIAYLGDLYGIYVPFLILSILATTTGALILFGLPETKDKDLPETFADSLRFKTLLDSCRMINRRNDKKRVNATTNTENAKPALL